jgi:4-oxalocrotonate tautomerase family enzyme
MPSIRIEILHGYSSDYKRAILQGVHQACVDALKIPDSDRNQRLVEYPPENFEHPSKYSDQFIVIELNLFPGRSVEAKKLLYRKITDYLEKNPGIPKNDVLIIINEPALENWGIRGGVPASDVKLEYSLNV